MKSILEEMAKRWAEIRSTGKCPYCQATTRQPKAGKTKAGSQRYRCMYCLREYTQDLKHWGVDEGARDQALEMAVVKGGVRSVPQQSQTAFKEVTLWSDKMTVPFVKNKVIQRYSRDYMSTTAPLSQEAPRTLVRQNHSTVAQIAESASTYRKWGLLPEIALFQAVSLLLVAFTFVTARAGNRWSEAFFWIGLAIMILPVAVRLYSTETSRDERIALILLLGGAFYLVKIMHSPYAFTFPDEFSTFRNAREILENQRLFVENPELPATALYPSLATITSHLVSLSGLSIFPAGLLVISAARFVLFLSLFLLYEQVSNSARIAGLGTLFYMANSNFLFYNAEFSYESLALPMAIFVLYIVARRETKNEHRLSLTVVALFGVFMVVISHHMTSYILTVLLFAATGISILRTRTRQRGPWDLALVATLAASFWLFYVATYTIQYLSPVLWKAVHSIFRLAMQEETSRQLFKSSSTTYVSPLWEKLTVYCSLLIVALGLPIGWVNLWRRYRNRIFALLLGVIAFGFLPMQGLRLTSAGWETANRSSEFLFIGVGFVLGLAIDQSWGSGWIKRASIWFPAGITVIMIFGGFIAGWPPQVRMPRPYLVDTGSGIVQPPYVQVAQWMIEYLGPDHRIATSKVGSKLFSAYAEEAPFTGDKYGIKAVLQSGYFGANEEEIIRNLGIEYIVYDRRRISWDLMAGFFFFNPESSPPYEFLQFETFEKFDHVQDVNRILDTGDIVIYDVRAYLKTPLEGKEMPVPATRTPPTLTAAIITDQPNSADQAQPLGSAIEAKQYPAIDQDHQAILIHTATVKKMQTSLYHKRKREP